MPKRSSGILIYRVRGEDLEVFLVHPGGPYWANKDDGAWSIPKGELEEGEDPLAAALRETEEETGCLVEPPFIELTPRRQPSGKVVYAWAAEGNCDPEAIRSNTFEMEWPPKSGRMEEFPEVDRAAWFTLPAAKQKVHKGQVPFIDELGASLHYGSR